MNKEFDIITKLLGRNEYPKQIIENQRKKYLDEKMNIKMPKMMLKTTKICLFPSPVLSIHWKNITPNSNKIRQN